jgi:hypothetical protein
MNSKNRAVVKEDMEVDFKRKKQISRSRNKTIRRKKLKIQDIQAKIMFLKKKENN